VALPVVDLRTTTPGQLVARLAGSSCVLVTGHGLDEDLREAVLRTAQGFFALPDEAKEAVQWSGLGPWRGWQPVLRSGPESMLLERFEVALEPGGQDGPAADWAASFDQWPAEPAGFAAAWTAAYGALHRTASQVTALLAHGLGRTDDLAAWTTRQHANLVVNHYPAQPTAPEPGRVRQRAHTDIGGVTLLWVAPGAGGLEARVGPGGSWVPVDIPAGCLLLQAGDLLRRWSQGALPANEHRVVNPPRTPGLDQVARWSLVYFHHPDLATWVAPGGAGLGAGTAEEHVLARQRGSTAQESAG
jgi:isopenicillin N synthase-like dioxygenase